MARDRIIVYSRGGQSGIGALGGVVLIAGIGVGGYFLFDAYTNCKWPFDGTLFTGKCGGQCVTDICKDGYVWDCVNGHYVRTSERCVAGQCQLCKAYSTCAVVPGFPTQTELDMHYDRCHPSSDVNSPVAFIENPVFRSEQHASGAKRVQYTFCRPVWLMFLTGTINMNSEGWTGGCNKDIHVSVLWDGVWSPVAAIPFGGTADDVPVPVAMSPSAKAEAIRFEGHGSGPLCWGGWDPRINSISCTFGVALASEHANVPPLVCNPSLQVGWSVITW